MASTRLNQGTVPKKLSPHARDACGGLSCATTPSFVDPLNGHCVIITVALVTQFLLLDKEFRRGQVACLCPQRCEVWE